MVGRRFFSLVVLFLEIRARLFGSITTSRCPRSAICTSRLKRLNHVAISGRGLCKMSLEPLRRGVEVDRNSGTYGEILLLSNAIVLIVLVCPHLLSTASFTTLAIVEFTAHCCGVTSLLCLLYEYFLC